MEGNRLWRLVAYPDGPPTKAQLSLVEEAPTPLEAGHVRIRTVYVSIDPSGRLWIRPEGSYLPAFPLGSVVPGLCIWAVA